MNTIDRKWMWIGGIVLLAFLLVLPFLVYLAGLLSLGPYEGGIAKFLGSLFGALLRLEPAAWLLVLGPWLLVSVLRFTTRPLRRR